MNRKTATKSPKRTIASKTAPVSKSTAKKSPKGKAVATISTKTSKPAKPKQEAPATTMSRLQWKIILPDGRVVGMRGDEDQMDTYVTRVAKFDGTWTAHPKRENWWGYSNGTHTVFVLPKEDWDAGERPNSRAKRDPKTSAKVKVNGKRLTTGQKAVNAANRGNVVKSDVKYRADYSEAVEDGYDVPANVRRLTTEANLAALKDKIAAYEEAEGDWARGWSGKWKGLHFVVTNNRGNEQYRVSIKKVTA